MFGVDDAILAAMIASTAASAGGVANSMSNQEDMKGMTAEQIRMSKASRTDAFGNTVRYDPTTNSWNTELTPEQKALVMGGEREQRLNVTQDAARNRTIREQLGAMGRGAGEDYNTARAEYAERPPSEEATRSEIMRLLTEAQGTGDRATAKLVGTQGLRQKGNMPVINSGPQSPDAGARLSEQMLKARQAALGEVGQRQQVRAGKLPAMAQFAQVAGGGTGQISLPDTEKTLLGEIDKSATGVNNAYHSAEGANNAAAGLTGKSFANLAQTLARSKLGGSKASTQPSVDTSNWFQPGTNFGGYRNAPSSYDDPWMKSTQSNPGDSGYW